MYARMLEKYPLTTKIITSGVLFSVGDAITQKYIQARAQFDVKRNLYFFATGAIYLAPCLHVWYCNLIPKITNTIFKTPTSTFKTAFTGMMFDQLLFAPIFLSGFFVFRSFIQTPNQKGIEKGVQGVKSKIWETLLTNWKIWPLATLINLSYVPIQYRVLFANFVGLFWNIYLSYIQSR